MDDKAEGQDGNHNADEAGGHEVAAQLEQAITLGEKLVVQSHSAELPGEGVYDGEKINGAVKQQEDDKKGAGDALNELLADGGG